MCGVLKSDQFRLHYCVVLFCSLVRSFVRNSRNGVECSCKLTRLQNAAHKKRHKTDRNWVRNISSRPLDENETQVLSYGLKHSVTPKHIPTDDIVSSVESVLARQRELPESTKDDIRSRIASTLQSASLSNCNLTKSKLHALRRLRNDKDIVILPADKGRVTVVMDKKDYTDKMDSLVNDKQT